MSFEEVLLLVCVCKWQSLLLECVRKWPSEKSCRVLLLLYSSVLQCVAVCSSAVQCVETSCSVFQHVAVLFLLNICRAKTCATQRMAHAFGVE